MNMKMKFLLAPALSLISGAGLWAQAAAPATPAATKMAVIDMQAAIGNTKEGQARIAELQKKYGPKEQEFQKRSQDIQAKQDQLKKTQNTISEEAKATLASDITRMQTALQRDKDDAQADSEQDEQKMLQDVGKKVVDAVTKYAQDNQIMIVFDLSSQPNNLVCCASAPDITRDVIALTDKMSASPAPAAATKPPAASAPAKPTATAPAK